PTSPGGRDPSPPAPPVPGALPSRARHAAAGGAPPPPESDGRHRRRARGNGAHRRARGGLVRTSLLPVLTAVGLMLFCTAATPRPDSAQAPPSGPAPQRLGDWAMPELIPNGPASAAATAAAAAGSPSPGADAASLDTAALAGAAADPGGEQASFTLEAGAKGIPARVLAAYRGAGDRLAREQPRCRLRWELLAGIGKVESGHAAGRPIRADGTITRPIIGPPLDGRGGRALIRDSDAGRLDGDTRFDRAVGPMQFIPTTWAISGQDGSGDGRRDPHNIDDAALAAGHYLCAGGRDLAEPAKLRAAIFSYNPSDDYVRAVLGWTAGYEGGGVTALPSTTVPDDAPSVDPIPVVALTTLPTPAVPATPNAPSPAPSRPATAAASGPSPSSSSPLSPSLPLSPSSPSSPSNCPVFALARDDLLVHPADLDPAAAGYEALDLLSERAPRASGTVVLRTEARTTAGALVATVRRAMPDDAGATAGSAPTLLARIMGHPLAAAPLPDHLLTLTLSVDAEPGCPARVLLTARIRNVDPKAFGPSPTAVPASTPTAAPTSTPPSTPASTVNPDPPVAPGTPTTRPIAAPGATATASAVSPTGGPTTATPLPPSPAAEAASTGSSPRSDAEGAGMPARPPPTGAATP
ncbi:lytic murein transglycosylase, partial [Frankia gtarii]|uniref:lytic murein transglycosylase n=1 Tax=Frankia gtarii TaxID=2950102 RepID=UPI0021BF8138